MRSAHDILVASLHSAASAGVISEDEFNAARAEVARLKAYAPTPKEAEGAKKLGLAEGVARGTGYAERRRREHEERERARLAEVAKVHGPRRPLAGES